MKHVMYFLLLVLIPLTVSGAEALRFRYAASIYADAGENKIIQPEGVGCNDQSLGVVADTGNNRLLAFSFADGVAKEGTEIKAPELSYPIQARMNSKGEMFALDGKKRRILRFGPDGSFKGFIDAIDVPAPATLVPRSFVVDRNDALYILDIFSGRVLVLGPDAHYQRQIELPRMNGVFSDIAVDVRGTIYLIESSQSVVWTAAKDAAAFKPLTKSLRDYMDFPISVMVDNRGLIVILDQHGGGVVILGPDGSFLSRQLHMGWTEGLVNFPAQLCLNEKGEMFIADRNNNRVQIFTVVK